MLPDFVISDTHWGHRNINKYCQRLTPAFPTKGSVERLMISNWHGTVTDDDTILHLGDMLGTHKPKNHRQWLQDLPGKKFVIRGNHDKWTNSFIEEHGFTVLEPYWIPHDNAVISFSHFPREALRGHEYNIHGHIHNNSYSGLTRAHINVSVEVRAFCPQPLMALLDGKRGFKRQVPFKK